MNDYENMIVVMSIICPLMTLVGFVVGFAVGIGKKPEGHS